MVEITASKHAGEVLVAPESLAVVQYVAYDSVLRY